jgi:hypothetical protein
MNWCADLPPAAPAADARERGSPRCRSRRRMLAAALPFAAKAFHHPMAAVAGAVAEAILNAMCRRQRPSPAPMSTTAATSRFIWRRGRTFTIAMGRPARMSRSWASLRSSAADPVRGIATSGQRGRSFSLRDRRQRDRPGGATAPTADAAATLIANAVDLPGHPAILRVPACDVAARQRPWQPAWWCAVVGTAGRGRDRRRAGPRGRAAAIALIDDQARSRRRPFPCGPDPGCRESPAPCPI